MQPDFALSLSYDGIRLLHRSGRGWKVVGDVSLDSDDLAGALAALRADGLALAGGGEMRCRVVLPDDQIRYLTLDTDQTSQADVEAVLDGATPYALEELRIDHVRADGQTYVAAVARETLDEAEAFASMHDFGPLCFAAAPDPDTFPGEVFFGETVAAATLLPDGPRPERADRPVALNGGQAPRRRARKRKSEAAVAPAAAAEVATQIAQLPEAEPPQPDLQAEVADPEAVAEAAPADDPAFDEATVPAAGVVRGGDAFSADDPVTPSGGDDAANGATVDAPPAPDEGAADPATPHDAGFTAAPEDAPAFAPEPDPALAMDEGAQSAWERPDEPPLAGFETTGTGLSGTGASGIRAADLHEADPDVAPMMVRPEAAHADDLPVTGDDAPLPAQPVFASRSRAMRPDLAEATDTLADTDKARDRAGTDPVPMPPPPSGDAGGVTLGPIFVRGRVDSGQIGTRTLSPPWAPHLTPPMSPDLATADAVPPVLTAVGDDDRDTGSVHDTAEEAQFSSAVPDDVVPEAPMIEFAEDDWGDDEADVGALSPGQAEAIPGVGAPGPGVVGLDLPSGLRAGPSAGGLAAAATATRIPPAIAARMVPPRREPATPLPPALAAALRDGPALKPGEGLPPRYTPTALYAPDGSIAPRQAPARSRAGQTAAPPGIGLGAGIGGGLTGAERAGGRASRWLLVVLMSLLLIALAGVAAFAAFGTPGLARWLGGERAVASSGGAAVPERVAQPGPEVMTTTPLAPSAGGAGAVPEGLQGLAENDMPGGFGDMATLDPEHFAGDAGPDGAGSESALLRHQDAANPAALAAASAAVGLAIADLARGAGAEAPSDSIAAAIPEDALVAEGGTPVTPEEADRFYAQTGVWIRAPRLPLLPRGEDIAGLTRPRVDSAPPGRDAPPDAFEALILAAADAVLPVQPVPFGPASQIPRDERGFILATPEGALSPRGIMLYAAAPPVTPPDRPEGLALDAALPAEDAPPEGADAAAVTAETVPAAETDAQTGAEVVAEEIADETALETVGDAPGPGAVGLAGLRPEARPAALAAPTDPEPETEVLVGFDGPRPAPRPADLAPAPAPPEPEPAAAPEPEPEPAAPPEAEEVPAAQPASPVDEVAATLAAIVQNAPDPLASITPLAVAVATRPDARPRNFDRVVTQQAARTQPTAPATSPGAVATAPATSQQAATSPTTTSPATTAPRAAQPSGPVPTTVARAATIDNAINLREINLIGVYGRPSDRRALVRLGNGRYQRVAVGDSLDGGQVTAISDNQLSYVKRGRTITLSVPTG